MALVIECENFKPFAKNTLLGFAVIKIPELRLRVKDIAIHRKNGSTWAALPSKPQLKDGKVVTNAEGKAQYATVLEFTDKATSEGFSRSVVVLRLDPNALGASNG
jgi:hypothetical protein